MFMKRKKLSWSLAIVISMLIGGGGIGYAKVTGMCSNCHTMHNSQGGSHMIINTTIDNESGGAHGGGYPSLLRGSCVGCHTGTNVGGGSTPYVYSIDAPNYGTDTLAGGNFYWATQDDAKGHNVSGIPAMAADGILNNKAPGSGQLCDNTSCHGTLYEAVDPSETYQVNTGCEGCHLEPKHHAPQQAAGTAALAANGYFRFLKGHVDGDGVHGIEDSGWEFAPTPTAHNEYLGSTDATPANTMTGYCIGCHGNFHVQQDANANWIRHPSDAVIPATGEYAAYTAYDPNVPVARPSLSGVSGTVTPGTDMVMCLSCHRAHGSPNDDMLRWSYTGMVAGGGAGADGTGCFTCHSEKDQ